MWGLIIVGLAAGWDPAPAFLPVLLYGLRFWILKLLVCIFALDSAEAQKPDRKFFSNGRLPVKLLHNHGFAHASAHSGATPKLPRYCISSSASPTEVDRLTAGPGMRD